MLSCTFRTRKVPTEIFGYVRYPILRIPIRRRAACRLIWKKSKLNWKLKISITRQMTLTSVSRRNVTLGIVECRK